MVGLFDCWIVRWFDCLIAIGSLRTLGALNNQTIKPWFEYFIAVGRIRTVGVLNNQAIKQSIHPSQIILSTLIRLHFYNIIHDENAFGEVDIQLLLVCFSILPVFEVAGF